MIGEAANGLEALHLAAERHPDMVLTDVHMPVSDRLEATRLIKPEESDVDEPQSDRAPNRLPLLQAVEL